MRSNGNYTIKQINELIETLKSDVDSKIEQAKKDTLKTVFDKGSYYLTEDSSVTTTTLANKFGGVWIKLGDDICLMSSSSDKTSNSNQFYVENSNIKQFEASGSHSHRLYSNDNYSNTVTGIQRDSSEKCLGTLQDGNKSYQYQNTSSGSSNKLVEEATTKISVGVSSPTNINLTNIIKRPKLFIFKRTN